jgi:hypothetical protein
MTWHWDGAIWRQEYGYNAGDFLDELFGVCAPAPDSIWAVGMSRRQNQTFPLVERWDHQQGRWIGFEAPSVGGDGYFRDVSGIAADDVWAVGFAQAPAGDIFPVAAHWDGIEWRSLNPTPPRDSAIFESVVQLASDDVWAFGSRGPQGAHQAYVAHWDGAQWQDTNPPSFDGGAVLWDGAALTPTDLVAVGGYWEGPTVHVLVLHWDGTAWTRHAVPDIPVPGAIYPPQGNQYLRCATAAKGVFWASGIFVNVWSHDMLDANTA